MGLDKMHKSPETKLLYVTTGVLKQMLINDVNVVHTYTHIILDEVSTLSKYTRVADPVLFFYGIWILLRYAIFK